MGDVVVARRGSPWVGWLWLSMGGLGFPWVVLARYGSVGFDGLARLDSMVTGLDSIVTGLASVVVGLV